MTCKIGILVSGRGTNMEAIVDRIAAEKADVQPLFVASDNAFAAGLRLARQRGITPQQIAARFQVPDIQHLTRQQCSDQIDEWRAA